MRVALVQLAASVDSAANRELVDARLDALEPGAHDLVVLPEATMHDFGSPDHDLAAHAEPLDGPFVQLLAEHARRLRTTIVAGTFETTDDLPLNTLVVLGPDGHLHATYRKIHLYDSFGYRESDRLRPGTVDPVTVDVPQGDGGTTTVGLMTCYDLRFPELARALVDRGAELLLVPAAWVAGDGKLHHWRTLLTARAIENVVPVAAAAQGGDRYTGHSLVVDALGSIVAEGGTGEDDLVTTRLDADDTARARDVNPSLQNRRMRAVPARGRDA